MQDGILVFIDREKMMIAPRTQREAQSIRGLLPELVLLAFFPSPVYSKEPVALLTISLAVGFSALAMAGMTVEGSMCFSISAENSCAVTPSPLSI